MALGVWGSALSDKKKRGHVRPRQTLLRGSPWFLIKLSKECVRVYLRNRTIQRQSRGTLLLNWPTSVFRSSRFPSPIGCYLFFSKIWWYDIMMMGQEADPCCHLILFYSIMFFFLRGRGVEVEVFFFPLFDCAGNGKSPCRRGPSLSPNPNPREQG